ncbi:rhodanese-like domain-containing protein [Mariniflexile sp. AS56]|nr:rhodanese-like domain-containing protein [Mariniflexile sp. AS56]MDO7170821.1 rhodanese-like domain-containing protein [Mariniflexile sp. AS56]
MKKLTLAVTLLMSCIGFSQKDLSKLLKQQNTESIPYISIETLVNKSDDFILLDSREQKEYDTSHLKNARFVGYDHFDLQQTTKQLPNKQQTIVVYCSLGIRSEDTAEKLLAAGYTNVFNLYGGIFEWKNQGLSVYDSNNLETEKVHTFSKAWSKWLLKGEKIYD